MAEKKSFSYEGNVKINKDRSPHLDSLDSQVEIMDVEFLTPAKIKYKSDGVELSIMVSVDIINRKAYDLLGNAYLSEEIFNYLDTINNLPEDFFIAPEEVRQQASQADLDHKQFRKDILGEING